MNLISVIITTYNWPDALELCLKSLFAQSDLGFEIIIADDGSTFANQALARVFCASSPVVIQYLHHEDQGFRAGTIRNKAVAASHGNYLLFIDGDCVVRTDFIARHRALARVGYFIPGNRVLLDKDYTGEVIDQRILLHQQTDCYFLVLWMKRKINRITALIRLPLGIFRYLQPKKWQKAMTCNLGIWKKDFLQVNGFDELFEGWGYEDSDLVIRLIHAGVKRKEGRFSVPVFHLWHRQHDRSRQEQNYQRLLDRLAQPEYIAATRGVSQYL